MVYDFAKLERFQDVKELEDKLKIALHGKDVSILVNNVGVMHVGPLDGATIESVRLTINVNINAQTYMSQLFMRRFATRLSNFHCAIVSISSKASELPSGGRPMYGSTKRYNRTLSEALNDYSAGRNIDILTVVPASTTTNMNPNTQRIFTVTAK